MKTPERRFEDKPAVREKTPLLTGIVGPSGTGKTFSALRLATGIQRVVGGDIHVIDTEARRALHYADRFKFRHTPFTAPFGPLDYLAAIEHCVKKGAGVIVIDSMSHEHEGPGGVLEQHDAELTRIAGDNWEKRQKCNMLAWQKPKAARRKLINGILQLGANVICCFRAKEKLKLQTGKEPLNLGWMPIAGEEFVFEMTLKCLLLPGADGVPTWHPAEAGEKAMCKLPIQFRDFFKDKQQLSEDVGQKLAEWAAGTVGAKSEKAPADALLDEYPRCADRDTFAALEKRRGDVWKSLNNKTRETLKAASDAADKRIAAAATTAQPAAGGVETDEFGVPIDAPPGQLFDNESGAPVH